MAEFVGMGVRVTLKGGDVVEGRVVGVDGDQQTLEIADAISIPAHGSPASLVSRMSVHALGIMDLKLLTNSGQATHAPPSQTHSHSHPHHSHSHTPHNTHTQQQKQQQQQEDEEEEEEVDFADLEAAASSSSSLPATTHAHARASAPAAAPPPPRQPQPTQPTQPPQRAQRVRPPPPPHQNQITLLKRPHTANVQQLLPASIPPPPSTTPSKYPRSAPKPPHPNTTPASPRTSKHSSSTRNPPSSPSRRSIPNTSLALSSAPIPSAPDFDFAANLARFDKPLEMARARALDSTPPGARLVDGNKKGGGWWVAHEGTGVLTHGETAAAGLSAKVGIRDFVLTPEERRAVDAEVAVLSRASRDTSAASVPSLLSTDLDVAPSGGAGAGGGGDTEGEFADAEDGDENGAASSPSTASDAASADVLGVSIGIAGPLHMRATTTLQPLSCLTPAQKLLLDRASDARGVGEIARVENGGRGVAMVACQVVGRAGGGGGGGKAEKGDGGRKGVVIVVSPSHPSSAHAVSAARHLANLAVDVRLVVVGLKAASLDAHIVSYRSSHAPLLTDIATLHALSTPALVIEAISIPFSSPDHASSDALRAAQWCRTVQRTGSLLASLDVPAGIDGTSGRPVSPAFPSLTPRYSVAVAFPLVGLARAAKEATGEVLVVYTGVPRVAVEDVLGTDEAARYGDVWGGRFVVGLERDGDGAITLGEHGIVKVDVGRRKKGARGDRSEFV
ncbi:hypothetical protein M427DRAFT_53281 [Gonapodya prolifera JEL478]|uniref:Enhancer of mRNA-decapping protein 3 n=1 Tax=Gonapodya prolifera (strain JEL478) TaxID=1344416 RepID=A0A139AQ51_GONPJ|nr:hypothetical protein M427DRAFT_53281 [Gonapodya prolifera JEL478]|eukprot:KXS18784.1 hypothetical protein M427DRAFT_53281 [Gonapodya prolifera JEL478]